MRSLLNWILFLPVALIVLIFAVINRQSVNVILDPFGSDIPGLRFEAPLFAVLFLALALGVIVGAAVTWVRQGRHRRALREARTEIAHLRAERIRLIGERQALPDARDHAA